MATMFSIILVPDAYYLPLLVGRWGWSRKKLYDFRRQADQVVQRTKEANI